MGTHGETGDGWTGEGSTTRADRPTSIGVLANCPDLPGARRVQVHLTRRTEGRLEHYTALAGVPSSRDRKGSQARAVDDEDRGGARDQRDDPSSVGARLDDERTGEPGPAVRREVNALRKEVSQPAVGVELLKRARANSAPPSRRAY